MGSHGFRLALVLLAGLALSTLNGCPLFGDDEEGEPAGGTLYDLSAAEADVVDPDYRLSFDLAAGEYGGYYVPVQAGRRYFVLVEVESGDSATVHVTSSDQPVIGADGVFQIDAAGGQWFEPSWSGRMYVLVRSNGAAATVFTGVYTYEPGAGPPASATLLVVNDVKTEGRLLPGESALYYFEARQGVTYEILTSNSSGSADLHAGTSSALAPDNAEHSDAFADNGIRVVYQSAMTVYILVVDRGTSLGTDYTVRVVSDDEPSPSIEGILSLVVNDVPTPGTLLPSALARYSFPTVHGRTYRILADQSSGRIDLTTSLLACVDDQVFDAEDAFGDHGIEVLATDEGGRRYFAAVDRGTDLGSDYTVRVISYDEPSVSLPMETLSAGAPITDINVGPSELRRFRLATSVGTTYRVSVTRSSGSLDSYLSVLSCVDHQVFEKEDAFADNGISFVAQAPSYYVAIVDRGTELGSTFSIELSEQ